MCNKRDHELSVKKDDDYESKHASPCVLVCRKGWIDTKTDDC